jgi:hypothetical protein
MASQLELYNAALAHLGPVRLSNLGEERPDRYELDQVYAATKQAMLERGIWYFALRSIEWFADPNVVTNFGQQYAFSFPSDYVRMRRLGIDETQDVEDWSYVREGQYYLSNYNTLYMTYVSNGSGYGANETRFSQLYADAFAAELAYRCALPVTRAGNDKLGLERLAEKLLTRAKRVEAVDERTKFKPVSSWVRARGISNSDQQRRRSS